MIGTLLLLVALDNVPQPPPPQVGDTLRITRELLGAVGKWPGRVLDGRHLSRERDRCLGDEGQDCFEGDPDDWGCGPLVGCRHWTWRAEMLEVSLRGAREHPDASLVVGFAAYSLLKFKRPTEAFQIAQGCRAVGWWCGLLRGYVFQTVGNSSDAHREFRAATKAAPDSVACLLGDASWALPEPERRRLQALPCTQRLAASDTLWWLSDPLFATEENERWSEHVARGVGTRLVYMHVPYAQFEPFNHQPLLIREYVLGARIPRGVWDSWEYVGQAHPLNPPYANTIHYFTGLKVARYHFVPDFADGDFSKPTWRLNATLADEGYTPAGPPFHALPVQVARFRRADSLLVAVAGSLAGSPLAGSTDATAHLFLSDAPGSFPLALAARPRQDRAIFLAQAPPARYVTSFEVLAPAAIGWHREMLEPLAVEGAGLSDVLLYAPFGLDEPADPRAAAARMLGGTVLTAQDQLGLYWESYGAPEGAEVGVELEVRGERGGLISRIGRLVLGAPEERGRLAWTEPSPGPLFPRAVVLDMAGLARGRYRLTIRTWWPGQAPIESRRDFEVSE